MSSPIRASVNVDGLVRTYLLYVPKDLNTSQPAPLVIAFHGGATIAERFSDTTRFQEIAERKGFIVAYPQGINDNWNDGIEARNSSINDILFTGEVVKDVELYAEVDKSRVYAAGISNGGFFVQYLAAVMPNKFAAFSSAAATIPVAQVPNVRQGTGVSMILFNGTDDTFVPYEGGEQKRGAARYLLSAPQTFEFWAAHNSSADISRKTIGGDVEVRSAKSGIDNSTVDLYTIIGGGHTWPGGFNQPRWLVGRTTNTINATRLSLDFFESASASSVSGGNFKDIDWNTLGFGAIKPGSPEVDSIDWGRVPFGDLSIDTVATISPRTIDVLELNAEDIDDIASNPAFLTGDSPFNFVDHLDGATKDGVIDIVIQGGIASAKAAIAAGKGPDIFVITKKDGPPLKVVDFRIGVDAVIFDLPNKIVERLELLSTGNYASISYKSHKLVELTVEVDEIGLLGVR